MKPENFNPQKQQQQQQQKQKQRDQGQGGKPGQNPTTQRPDFSDWEKSKK